MSNEIQGGDLHLAIVGMAVRLPGADSPEAFWRNLRNGVESITFFSKEELMAAGLDAALVSRPNYVPARAILADVEKFDCAFFGLSPREAALLDPQQRILLECAWEALDGCGCACDAESRACGVYAGVGMNGYLLQNVWGHRALFDSTEGFQAMLGNDKDFCATRISYKLNLKGPSIAVQTACSSSLVAIHLACQGLLQGECDLAIAGGCAAFVPQRSGYLYEPGMIFSPDGHCRPFDSSAAGTVAGSGAGIIVLKRLEDALADRDDIHALVLGSAINNDGAIKVGYTAPSVEGQRAVITEALGVAGATPDSIGFIEAHGTGTPQGDPIEFEALLKVFGSAKARNGRCALGSVKSNFGHLDAAAGVAGLIKAVLALRNRLIPGTLHFERPNPAIDLAKSPFFIPASPVPWDVPAGLPRRAGVSSFGIGGTNAHVVLQEASAEKLVGRSKRHHAFVLSAKSETGLAVASQNLANYLENTSDLEIGDVAFALNSGRRLFAHRRVIRAPDRVAAIEQLRNAPRAEDSQHDDTRRRSVIFLFPGRGDGFSSIARGLYQVEPLFRKEFDRCANLFCLSTGCDLHDVLMSKESAGQGDRNQFLDSALFAIEYALGRCLMEWNVRPRAMMGHGLGEWVAACLAEVVSLEDAVRILALRSRLLRERMEDAPVNNSSSEESSDPFSTNFALKGHSEMNGFAASRLGPEPAGRFDNALIIKTLCKAMNQIKLQAPRIRLLAGAAGRRITTEEALDPPYWSGLLGLSSDMAECLGLPIHDYDELLLEVGPEMLVEKNCARPGTGVMFHLLPSPDGSEEVSSHLATALAQLHMDGVPVDWKAFGSEEGRRRVWLPPHPFQRERCWIDPIVGNQSFATSAAGEPERRKDFSEWFYQPGWRRSVARRPDPSTSCAGTWLHVNNSRDLFRGNADLPNSLAKKLCEGGADVVQVSAGDRFTGLSPLRYEVQPTSADDWVRVLEDIRSRNLRLRGILVFEDAGHPGDSGALDRDSQSRRQNLLQLIAIAQALGLAWQSGSIDIIFVTRDLHSIGSTEALDPWRALPLGVLRVIPQEFRGVRCRNVDVDLTSYQCDSRTAERVLAEILSDSSDDVVSYRGAVRWVPSFERVEVSEFSNPPQLRKHGVYLVTGGLGGIGLTLAKDLAQSYQARLILVSRSKFPDRREWERLSEEDTRTGRQARTLLQIESAGGECLLVEADVANERQMSDALAKGERRFGALNGVIHAAGIAGGGVLARKTPHAVEEVLRAKVEGLHILDKIFGRRELDFVVLCSSVTAWLGGFGQADYCAANVFLDAYAEAKARQGHPTFSIAWDTWCEVGMAVDTSVPVELRRLRDEELRRYGLTPSEGIQIFRRVLCLGLPQVVVSTRDFHSRYASRNEVITTGVEKIATTAIHGPRHQRPQLAVPFVSPRDKLEQWLAERWCENLGFFEIGVDDNYFDLGGDSLKGITFTSCLQREVGEVVNVSALFEAPTIAQLATYLEEHLPAAVARFQRTKARIEAKAAVNVHRDLERSEAPSVTTGNLHGIDAEILALPRDNATFPMSAGQRRLWFLNQLDGKGSAYHMPAALRIKGSLDVEALARSHREIIRRHETLRTTFATVGQEPMQRVERTMSFELPVIDLSCLSDASRTSEMQRIVQDCTRRPFDLAKGPLLRGALLRFAADDHLWILTVHHIVSDAWSMGVFIKEMSMLYRSFVLGEHAALPALSVQYADYAAWQADWLLSDAVAHSLAFWRKALAGSPVLLPLPWDRPRPVVRTSAGAHLRFALDAELTARLKTIGRESNGTLFTTLLTGFIALLSRCSGLEDIVVGTPVAGRSRPEFGPLIGFFVNNLVLRSDLSGNPTFRELLERTRCMFLEALANQDVPFDMLVESLQPPRSLSYTPVFQVVFGLLNLESNELDWPDLVLDPVDLDFEAAAFDLTLLMKETSRGLAGDFSYSLDLFDESTVCSFGRRFERLLQAAVTHPDVPLDRLEVLDVEERRMLLEGYNATEHELEGATLPELFERQVRLTPEAVAVEFEGEGLRYGELNERANRLAHHLIGLGVGPEEIVGISMERSLEMVVALLGVLKAGGAYMALDREYPAARIDEMVSDAEPVCVLTQEWFEEKRRDLEGAAAWDPVQKERRRELLAGDAANLIYTSGSTGKPKGVLNTHEGLVNRIVWMQHAYGLNATDRVLQKTPYSFDVSGWEFFWPLFFGARLIVAQPGKHREPQYLIRTIIERGITTIHFVPSMLRVFLEDVDSGSCGGLRRVICSGEALEGDLQAQFFEKLGAVELQNLYGPTEASIDVTAWRCQAGEETAPPIGAPVWNTRVYVLDARLEPVPVGVTGELYIAGVQLARGYLKRPALTAERFVPDPHGRAGTRMYRTGDLARWRGDGNVEYVGRRDGQVKIRGFRIEVGEIEAVLAEQAGVARAVVTMREEDGSGKQLVAYVVPSTGRRVEGAELRRALRERLPDYMVPAAFVAIEQLPLTLSGKLDRSALPAPDYTTHSAKEIAAPQSAMERLVAEIWQNVLAIEQIDVHENFFDLGGHSLLLARVQGQLRKRATPEIEMVDLFKYTTISSLAGFLDRLPNVRRDRQADSQHRLIRERVEKQKNAARRAAALHCERESFPAKQQTQ